MLLRRLGLLAPLAALSLLLAAPSLVEARSGGKARVNIKTVQKRTVINKPLVVQAVTRKRPRSVTFYVDGVRRYTDTKAPFRLNGDDGTLRTDTLRPGKHRITVRAKFKRRVARARIVLKVRHRVVNNAPVTSVTTKLPAGDVAAVAPAPPARAAQIAPATWSGLASAGFGSWILVQDGAHDPQYGDTLISIVDAPFAPGTKAFKFQVNGTTAANGPRAELADGYAIKEGEEWWFGDVLYLPSAPNRTVGWANSNHVLMQFHQQGGGSPPLALDLRDWSYTKGGDHSADSIGVQDLKGWHPVLPLASAYDRPIPIEFRVRFSSDPSRGSYELWVDGRQAYAAQGVATLFPGLTSGFKQGQYGQGRGNVVYWLGAKRGPSREAVLR